MSGVTLLDINVLLALFWPDNPNHFTALRWFEQNYKKGWATCPATQSGFVRLSSNRAFTMNALNPAEAISLLERNVRHPNHEFWAESSELADLLAPLRQRITGYRQIADACLLALAMKKRGRLVTFDKGVAGLLPPGTRKADWIIELSSRVH